MGITSTYTDFLGQPFKFFFCRKCKNEFRNMIVDRNATVCAECDIEGQINETK